MIGTEEEVEGGAIQSAPHEELCTRTSWVDARTALKHIYKGRATGSRGALWVRKGIQDQLYQLGKFSDRHAGKILFVAILIMVTLSVGIRSANIETNIEKLWVEEGGRLEKELKYVSKTLGDGTGTTNQILIQTPKNVENILTVPAMNAHLNVLAAATKVTVDMHQTSWSLKDLCYATTFRDFDNYQIGQIFEKLAPCAIITPLDCFWEGSKLLGPDNFVTIHGYGAKVKWTNLNPQRIVDKMRMVEDSHKFFPFDSFIEFMKRAGITTGYQQKPCLNPTDPACPDSAPNKQSKKAPDIGAELTGGCYGFAGKYLHWPEELVVGGTKKNRTTRHIIRGEALQSIVQLMGPKDLYEHLPRERPYEYIEGWSIEKARMVLDAWVEQFSQRVREVTEERSNETDSFNLQPFSSTSLTSLMRKFSTVSIPSLVIGCVVIVVYVSVCLFRLKRASESGAGLGFAGVLLVIASVTSGLGICALLGLPYNAATTQLLPFLALGLGVDGIFHIIHTVAEIKVSDAPTKGFKVSMTGEVMKRCGVSVLLTSVCGSAGFFAAAIVPVPAIRVLCLQAGILVLSTLAVIFLVFPSLVSLDIRRRKASLADILCCLPMFGTKNSQEMRVQTSSSTNSSDISKRTAVTRALSPSGRGTVTQVISSPPSATQECWVGVGSVQVPSPSSESLTVDSTRDLVREREQTWWLLLADCRGWSISRFVKEIYAPALTNGCVKVFVMVALIFTILASVWGLSQLKDGLDLTDIVPSGTNESQFFEAQQKYFGFYNMFAVTEKDFAYPTKQKLLHEYHEAFNRIPWIIKNDDGGLPDSWLYLFREWLLSLQRSFDSDREKGLINEEGWNYNTSDSAILAYKLLVQTGYSDNPVDKSLVLQGRLVDEEGIINPKAFYNYLTAWVSNDALAYSASQSDLRPQPKEWKHERSDLLIVEIKKSEPLNYSQFPFYLNQMEDTETVIQMIKEVRSICKKFEDKGLPNFPTGIPFTFWEQYINLRFFLLLALSAVLITVFLVLAVILVNIWAAALVVLVLACLVLQLAGFLGIMGLKLSAAPAVLLVVAVGMGVEFTVHITLGFLTAVGDRNRRVRIALTHMASPVMHGAMSTFLATLMLMFSEFDFIRRYFFYVIAALVLLGTLDGLLFLPVLLSLVGPPAELVSRLNPDRLPTPSPPVTPPPPYSSYSSSSSNRRQKQSHQQTSSSKRHHSHHYPSHHGSNISLTTITEEPASNGSSHSSSSNSSCSSSRHSSSHEILVEPQVVVETTTTYSGRMKPPGAKDGESPLLYDGAHVTTTVTATAKVKVELHKPVSGFSESVHRSCNSSQGSSSRRSSPTNVSVSSSRSSRSSSKRSASRSDSDSEGLRSSR